MKKNADAFKHTFINISHHAVLYGMMLAAQIPAAPIADGAPKFLGNIFLSNESSPSSFATYWNQVTLENNGKWGEVEPSRDQMNWASVSTAYNYTRSNGFPYKHHTFIWGTQAPGWIGGLSAAEQKAEVEEWIKAFGEKFPGTEFIDVVNEPLNTPPSYKDALGGAGVTGWDWVVTPFEMARKYCPGSKLLINEFEIEYDAALAAKYLQIIMILKEKKLVDGIGIQCHTNEIQRDKPPVAAIRGALDTLASSGLPIYISELDLKGDDATQLAAYKQLFPVFWEHPAVRGVTLWGYQGNIWNVEAVLMKNGVERPALKWLRQYVDSLKNTTSSRAGEKAINVSRPVDVHCLGRNHLSVTISSPEELSVKVTDCRGRIVFLQGSSAFRGGKHTIVFQPYALPAGAYIVDMRGDRTSVRRKLISVF